MTALVWPNGSTRRPRVTSPYGWRTHPVTGRQLTFHRGIDLAGWSTIVAPTAGTVTKVAYQAGGAGHYVNMRAGGGTVFKFFHLAARSPLRVGQRIAQGATIGRMGATGSATGVHLHLEVWPAGRSHTDPAAYYAAQQQPAPAQATRPTADPQEEDDMATAGFYYTRSDRRVMQLIIDTSSGWWHEYTVGNVAAGGTYNNPLAATLRTGTFAAITESHARVIKEACEQLRRQTVTGELTVAELDPDELPA